MNPLNLSNELNKIKKLESSENNSNSPNLNKESINKNLKYLFSNNKKYNKT
jgi:hypothetical protein